MFGICKDPENIRYFTQPEKRTNYGFLDNDPNVITGVWLEGTENGRVAQPYVLQASKARVNVIMQHNVKYHRVEIWV